MEEDARRTRVWYWSWMAAGVGLIGGQAALASVSSGDFRLEMTTGALTSIAIPTILLVHAPEILADGPRLEARLALTEVLGRPGDPCISVLRARELLARDAADERLAKSWAAHTLAIGFNVAVGLVLGLGFHDWPGAAKQLVGGSLVGEAQIWTLPGVSLRAEGMGIGGTF